jgi:hypothetical protein
MGQQEQEFLLLLLITSKGAAHGGSASLKQSLYASSLQEHRTALTTNFIQSLWTIVDVVSCNAKDGCINQQSSTLTLLTVRIPVSDTAECNPNGPLQTTSVSQPSTALVLTS